MAAPRRPTGALRIARVCRPGTHEEVHATHTFCSAEAAQPPLRSSPPPCSWAPPAAAPAPAPTTPTRSREGHHDHRRPTPRGDRRPPPAEPDRPRPSRGRRGRPTPTPWSPLIAQTHRRGRGSATTAPTCLAPAVGRHHRPRRLRRRRASRPRTSASRGGDASAALDLDEDQANEMFDAFADVRHRPVALDRHADHRCPGRRRPAASAPASRSSLTRRAARALAAWPSSSGEDDGDPPRSALQAAQACMPPPAAADRPGRPAQAPSRSGGRGHDLLDDLVGRACWWSRAPGRRSTGR